MSPLPTILDLTPPESPLLASLLEHMNTHLEPSTINHCIRPVYFMLLIAKKLPPFADLVSSGVVDLETGMLALLMHDLGWATTKSFLSKDKRYEVDGADLAVKYIQSHIHEVSDPSKWDRHRLEAVWSSIALHTSPSIALHHFNPIVPLTQLAIFFDFVGPYPAPWAPKDIVTEDDFKAIVKAYPRLAFKDHFISIMCGMVREKKETTFDTFMSQFGAIYGTDGKGAGREEYAAELEQLKGNLREMLLGGLDRTKGLEAEVGGE